MASENKNGICGERMIPTPCYVVYEERCGVRLTYSESMALSARQVR